MTKQRIISVDARIAGGTNKKKFDILKSAFGLCANMGVGCGPIARGGGGYMGAAERSNL